MRLGAVGLDSLYFSVLCSLPTLPLPVTLPLLVSGHFSPCSLYCMHSKPLGGEYPGSLEKSLVDGRSL